MQKHCIFEHFFRFVKQNRPKPSVIVTLQKKINKKAEDDEREGEVKWNHKLHLTQFLGRGEFKGVQLKLEEK